MKIYFLGSKFDQTNFLTNMTVCCGSLRGKGNLLSLGVNKELTLGTLK